MKKIKIAITFLLFAYAFTPMCVCAAEVNENGYVISEGEVSPRALITNTNVRKRSQSDAFLVSADIVTNDGTMKIVDIRNISLIGRPAKLENIQINLSSGEICNNGEYATVSISYMYGNEFNTDIVIFYPYGR